MAEDEYAMFMKNIQNMQRNSLTQAISRARNSIRNHSLAQRGAYALAGAHAFLAGTSAAVQGETLGYGIAAFLMAIAGCYIGLGATGGRIMENKSAGISKYTEQLKGLEAKLQ